MVKFVSLLDYRVILFDQAIAINYDGQGNFYDFLTKYMQDIVSHYNTAYPHSILGKYSNKINFFIEEDEFELNGYAELDSNNNLKIGINFGTLISICDLFHYACSDERFIQNYGYFGDGRFTIKESENNNRFFDYRFLEGCEKKGFLEKFLLDFPSEQERIYLAKLLTIYSFRFIYAHELGHYFRGHLHYLHSKKSEEKLKLFEVYPNAELFSERIVLEHEADQSAVTNSIDINEAVKVIKSFPNGKFKNHLDWARVFVISIGSTCLLFEKAKLIKGQYSNEYPSPACRLLNVLLRFAQTYQFRGNSYSKIFKEAYDDNLKHYFDNYTLDQNFEEIEIIINNALVDLQIIANILGIESRINFDYIRNDVLNEDMWNFSKNDDESNTLSPYGKELRRLLKYDSEVLIDKLFDVSKKAFPDYTPSRMYLQEYDDEESNQVIREENQRKSKLRE